MGGIKVTARRGELRLVGQTDFAHVSGERLAEAVRAFQESLRGEE